MSALGSQKNGGQVLMTDIDALFNINRKGRTAGDGGRISLGKGVPLVESLRSEISLILFISVHVKGLVTSVVSALRG